MTDLDLAALAQRLGKEIESLPVDSKEPFSITIGRDNAGNISLGGSHISIHITECYACVHDIEAARRKRKNTNQKGANKDV